MNWKRGKRLAALCLASIMTCSLCACQQSEQAGTAEAESDLPELKIGVDILEPFFYKDENGDYVGIDAEIAQAACEKAGYEPVFVDIPWDEKDEYLENGSVDCLMNAFSEDGREDKYLWTEPYLESDLKVLVDEKCPDENLKDLKSKGGIAVRAGSKAEEILLADVEQEITSTGKIYACGTFKLAKTAFIKGYAGALACHEAVLQQIMNENPGVYRLLEEALMTTHLGIAFSKDGDETSWEKINTAITELKEDGTISDIYEKYTQNTSEEEVTSDAEE